MSCGEQALTCLEGSPLGELGAGHLSNCPWLINDGLCRDCNFSNAILRSFSEAKILSMELTTDSYQKTEESHSEWQSVVGDLDRQKERCGALLGCKDEIYLMLRQLSGCECTTSVLRSSIKRKGTR